MPSVRPATLRGESGLQLLRSVAYALILYGVAGLIGAWLAGPTRLAVARSKAAGARARATRPDRLRRRGAVLFLLVLAWGPTQRDTRVVGILLLGGLLFFGVAMLHRQTVREFPRAEGSTDLA